MRFFKPTLLVAALLAVSTTSAVFAGPQKGFEALGGINYGSYSTNVSGSTSKSALGFFVGGEYEQPITKDSSISGGLTLAVNQGKVESTGVNAESTAAFINIPIKYNYYVGQTWKFSGGAYLGVPVTKLKTTSSGTTEESELNMDYGILIGASYAINPEWSVDLGYNLGLADLDKGNGEVKVSAFTLGGTYNF